MIEEQRLVARILNGDSDAEERFQRIFRPRLHRLSLQLLGDENDEASVTVRVSFVHVIPKLRFFNFRESAYVPLRQTCVARCYEILGRRSRHVSHQEVETELYLRIIAMERLQCTDLGLLQDLRRKLLDELKKQLSDENRRIMNMRDQQGLSYSQISLSLRIPLGTAITRLANARERLKRLIENICPNGLPDLDSSRQAVGRALGDPGHEFGLITSF